MDRLLPTLIIVAVILLIFALMLLGWRARRRRQSGLSWPMPAPEELGDASLVVDGWYVATTRADEPLERIAVHGLGFRARVTVSVHPEGVVLAVQGREPFLLAPQALRGVDRATWAIDRVVERDGLVRLAWMLGEDPVDSYLRLPESADAAALVPAVLGLTPRSVTSPEEGFTS
jgi:hypothetical protein